MDSQFIPGKTNTGTRMISQKTFVKPNNVFGFFSGFKGIWWKEKTVEGGTYGVRNVFMK